jgi:hypothetical protein
MFKRIYVQNSGTAFGDSSSDLTTVPDLSVQLVDVATGEALDLSAEEGNSNNITTYDNVRLLFRDGDYVDQSPVIPTADLEITDFDYDAPQQQEVEVTVPSGPVGGDSWALKVTMVDSGNQPYPRRSYEIQVDDGESASSIATKFANAINNAIQSEINDYNEPSVSASASSDVVTITADEVGDIFDVATIDFDASGITTTENPTDGVGTPQQVDRYESDDDGTVGRYVQSTNLLGSLDGPATYVDSAGEYDLLTFTFPGDSEKAVNKSIADQTYIVALESAVTKDYSSFFDPRIVASG